METSRKKSPGYWRIIWQQYRRNRLAVAGLLFIAMLIFVALAAPLIATNKPLYCTAAGACLKAPIPYTPTEYNLDDTLAPPSAKHWFGTDEQGRDVAARMVYGTRISLAVGVVAVGIYVLIGILLGAAAGYYGGWVDQVVSRAIEIMICFPTFFLILTLLAFVGPSIYNIMIIIGLTSWTGVARLVRGEFLKLKNQEFVQAAIALGANDSRVIFRHMLPNALAPVLVSATFGVAAAILIESGLSFLGFGVPPHVPSWGSILSQSQEFMDIAWWLTAVPGFAIFITITVYNIVGEGLRDAIDPRLKV